MNWDKLKEPFEPQEIEWRVKPGSSGIKKDGKPWAKVMAYVDSRAIQERLDAVCTPDGWQTKMTADAAGVICELGIKCGDVWIWKSDGAPYTVIDGYKGAISGALKRAACHWNIGRYLYGLPTGWATFVAERKGMYQSKIKKSKTDQDPKRFDWNPPNLPDWALPGKGPAFPATQSTATPSEPKAEDKGKGEAKKEKPLEAPGTSLGLGDQAKDIIRELDLCLTVKDVEAWKAVPGNRERIKRLDAREKEEVANHGAALREYLWFTDTLKTFKTAAEIRAFSVNHADSLSGLKGSYQTAINKLALELKAKL